MSNEKTLIRAIVSSRQTEGVYPAKFDDAFEVFSAEQFLKSYELSLDEIESGVVGQSRDGGLDGVFTFLGETLVRLDSEILNSDTKTSDVDLGAPLTIVLVQSKTSAGFAEVALTKIDHSTAELLDFNIEGSALRETYNEDVVENFLIFRTVLTRFASRKLKIKILVVYISLGDSASVHKDVTKKADKLREKMAKRVASDANAEVVFWGARELWDAHNAEVPYTLELPVVEHSNFGESHVSLVKVKDYISFITDEGGKISHYLFDANVRDFQGRSVAVNKQIIKTVHDPDSPEFWWLNNGITIICAKAPMIGNSLWLDDVQIVNGLQTSYTLVGACAQMTVDDPKLDELLLVKALVTTDPETRDAIIRATNSQTSVPAASLRATDRIQRLIENHFLDKGWFYERRKNYYKNRGKDRNRIVPIAELAQAIMAMGLGEPDNSRARPSSLLKSDDSYRRVFPDNLDLDVYLWLAVTQRKVDSFLKDQEAITSSTYTNLRFHLSFLAVSRLFGAKVYSPSQLQNLANSNTKVKDDELGRALMDLERYSNSHGIDSAARPDQAAKSREFVDFICSKEQI